jgi:hypothetical protein
MHIGVWQESQKETEYQEDQAVDGKIIMKWICDK